MLAKRDELDEVISSTKNKKKKKKLLEEREKTHQQLTLLESKLGDLVKSVGASSAPGSPVEPKVGISHKVSLSEEEMKKVQRQSSRSSKGKERKINRKTLFMSRSKKSKHRSSSNKSFEVDTPTTDTDNYDSDASTCSTSLSLVNDDSTSFSISQITPDVSPLSTPTATRKFSPELEENVPTRPDSSRPAASSDPTVNQFGNTIHTLDELKLRPVNLEMDKLEVGGVRGLCFSVLTCS